MHTNNESVKDPKITWHLFFFKARLQKAPDIHVYSVQHVQPASPPLLSLHQLVNYAYRHNIASLYPEPKDKEAFVLSHVYSPDYDSFTLDTYAWPQDAMNVQDV